MKNNMVKILTNNCTYQEGKLYCIAINFNLLFSIDIQSGKIELIDVIPEENALVNNVCGAINIWNDKLILTPCKTKKVWIYDLTSKHWDSQVLRECKHWGAGAFTQTYIYDDKIFLIGSSYPAILFLDLKNGSCEYIESPYNEIMERQKDVKYTYFRAHGVRLGNTLYLASNLDNYVLKFDMETKDHHWIKVGKDDQVYSGITWDGNHFWLSPRLNGDIVKWDGKEKVTILPLPSEFKDSKIKYLWEACFDGSQVILPASVHANSILIDVQKDSLKFYGQQYTLFVKLDNGMVVSQTIDGDLSIKMEGSSPKTFPIFVEGKQIAQFYDEKGLTLFRDQTLYYESKNNKMLSAENFLRFTKAGFQSQPTADRQIGKKIWENIR